MNEVKHVALTLDGTPSWFGYEKGVGHVVMSAVITQGGDHIGGNTTLAPVCPGSKPLDCHRAANGTVEKFQGDRKCKKCEAWLAGEAGQAAIESASVASFEDENADMIAELKANRSPERLAQIAATEAQWNAVAEAVADDAALAADKARYREIVAEIEAAESVSEPAVESEPVKIADPTADEPWTPRHPDSQFPRTGMLANEAAFVLGRSHSAAPADRRTVKVPGSGREVASRGTMSDPTGRNHLDESVKAPDAVQSFVDSHPKIVSAYGVTVREYNAMSDTAKRRYRRKLVTRSNAQYAADQVAKDERNAAARARRAAKKAAQEAGN